MNKLNLGAAMLLGAITSPGLFSANIIVDKTIERALSGKLTISNCNEKPGLRIDNRIIPAHKLYLVKTAFGYKYRARYKASADSALAAPFFKSNKCKGNWSPKSRNVNLKFKIINHNNINFIYSGTPSKPKVDKTIERAISGKIYMSKCKGRPQIKINRKIIPTHKLYLQKTAYGYKYRARYVASSDTAIVQPFFSNNQCKGTWSPTRKKVDLRFNIINFNNIDFRFKVQFERSSTQTKTFTHITVDGRFELYACIGRAPHIKINGVATAPSKTHVSRTPWGYAYRVRIRVPSSPHTIRIQPYHKIPGCVTNNWSPTSKLISLQPKTKKFYSADFKLRR